MLGFCFVFFRLLSLSCIYACTWLLWGAILSRRARAAGRVTTPLAAVAFVAARAPLLHGRRPFLPAPSAADRPARPAPSRRAPGRASRRGPSALRAGHEFGLAQRVAEKATRARASEAERGGGGRRGSARRRRRRRQWRWSLATAAAAAARRRAAGPRGLRTGRLARRLPQRRGARPSSSSVAVVVVLRVAAVAACCCCCSCCCAGAQALASESLAPLRVGSNRARQ